MHTIAQKNIRICLTCGNKYYRRGTRKFATCSVECRKSYITKLQTGKKRGPNSKWKGKVISKDCRGKYKKCLICQKEIYLYPSKINRTKYCSLKCRNKSNFWLKGKDCHRWKGGKTIIQGYMYKKSINHPYAHKKSGYVAEHRLVMEKKIGRYLLKNEQVHHKNGNKLDNRIKNLEIVLSKVHFGIIKCPYCEKDFKIK